MWPFISVPEEIPPTYLDQLLGPGRQSGFDSCWPASACASLVAWASLYWVLGKQYPFYSYEWVCRIVTMVHAITISAITGYSAFVEGPWPFTEPAGRNTLIQHWACVVALGYFLFDLGWCIYHKSEGPVMLFHHSLSIFGCCVVLWRGTNGCEFCATLFGTEITNPFLQIRWFLRNSGHRAPHSKPLAVVEFLFCILFVIMRIVVGTYFLRSYFDNPNTDWLTRAGGVTIYSVGYLFLFSLITYGVRKYTSVETWWKNRQAARTARIQEEQEEEEEFLRERQERRERAAVNRSTGPGQQKREAVVAPQVSNEMLNNRGVIDLKEKDRVAGAVPSYMKCGLRHDLPSLSEIMSAKPATNGHTTPPEPLASKSNNGIHYRTVNPGIRT